MKKLFLAAALMLAGTFAKAQTINIANGLDNPGCNIVVEKFCIPPGDCGALGSVITLPADFSWLILPSEGAEIAWESECYYRIKIPNCGDYWFQWFGSGPCATITSSTGLSCSECGTSGHNSNQILIQVDPITGDIDILEIP